MSHEVVAVVPVKPLSTAKGRLATALGPAERAELVLRCLDRVLAAVGASPAVERCLVVSSDPTIGARASAAGAAWLDEANRGDRVGGVRRRVATWGAEDADVSLAPRPEERGEDLATPHNRALEWARVEAVRRWHPEALLVLAGDLPLLTAADVEAMIALGAEPRTVVLAPDRHGSGTNALLLRPPDALPFRFGPNSFALHAEEAAARSLVVRTYRGRGTAVDVDDPDDLVVLARQDSRGDW